MNHFTTSIVVMAVGKLHTVYVAANYYSTESLHKCGYIIHKFKAVKCTYIGKTYNREMEAAKQLKSQFIP